MSGRTVRTAGDGRPPDGPTVDAHQHYWQPGRFAYGWLTPDQGELYRDYLPPEVRPQMDAAGIDSAVSIQAAGSPVEGGWLLELAARYPYIAGVVSWADLAAPDVGDALADLARYPRFKGVRPALPPPDGDWTALRPGLRALAEHGLACDLLVRGGRLPRIVRLIAAAPDVRFVIDHLADGTITPGGHRAWMTALRPLAALPNVALKLSGYLSAADPRPPTDATLRPYVDGALELFGAERLLYGSDWPVCTRGGGYADGIRLLRVCLATLSPHERAAIWGGTARRIYDLPAVPYPT